MASSSPIRDHQGGQATVEWLGVLALTTRPIARPVIPPTLRAPIAPTDSRVAVTASLPRLPLTRSCHLQYRDCHVDFTRSATRLLAKNLRSYSEVAAGTLLGGLICVDGGPLALACAVLAALNVEVIDRTFERAVQDHECASVHYGWGPSFPLVRIDSGPGCLN